MINDVQAGSCCSLVTSYLPHGVFQQARKEGADAAPSQTIFRAMLEGTVCSEVASRPQVITTAQQYLSSVVEDTGAL